MNLLRVILVDFVTFRVKPQDEGGKTEMVFISKIRGRGKEDSSSLDLRVGVRER